MKRTVLKVGVDEGDIKGGHDRALQAAADYLARMGGGTLEVLPGVYEMRNSLFLGSGIHLKGHGQETIFRKCAASESFLELDGDYGETEISLSKEEGFHPGDGISVTDEANPGFHTLVATILWKEGNTLGLDSGMRGDYLVKRGAKASTTFPLISGAKIENVTIEDITIEGNREANPYLNGCRGGGIYFFQSHDIRLHGCVVRHFHGDGISYQLCDRVTLEGCIAHENSHFGLHPGSGSSHTIIRHSQATGNGEVGLFVCWRVRHGRFENNIFSDNGLTGLSIGHKDTDNHFCQNRIERNGREGILFREELLPMGAHRNHFAENEISDNGTDGEGVGVRILNTSNDLSFHRNRIRDTGSGRQKVGFWIGEDITNLELLENIFEGSMEPAKDTRESTS